MPLENVDQIIGSNLKVSGKEEDDYQPNKTDTSNKKPRFIYEQFPRRETRGKSHRIRSNYIGE